ncbi:MAG: hypothetical protein K0Q72_202 [Armatimonadetes bacterium]|nr:hypothetical protein [Armatimonadota bacterium]
MRTQMNHVRLLAAAGVLVAGAAWAGTVYRTEPKVSGPNPAQLRTLAERLATSVPESDPLLDTAPSYGAPRISLPAPAKKSSTPAPARITAPRLPAVTPAPTVTEVKTPAPAPAPQPVSPVKSIALMGVTNRGDVETAWLVNVDSQERELAEVGDRAFGLTIKEIEPEAVVLTGGGEDYLLRLGDKQIPVQVASTSVGDDAAGMDPFGGGRRGRNGAGGQGSQGGGRRSGWGGAGGAGGGSSWGGGRNRGNFGSMGASSFGGGSGGSSFSSNSGNSGFSGLRGGNTMSSNSGRSRSGGGFSGGGGGGFSGGGFGGGRGGSSNTSQFAAGTSGPTSNPQTARRRGGQLTGDTPAQPMPAAISNPQTQRRIGSSSGAAFGMAQNNIGRTTGTRQR